MQSSGPDSWPCFVGHHLVLSSYCEPSYLLQFSGVNLLREEKSQVLLLFPTCIVVLSSSTPISRMFRHRIGKLYQRCATVGAANRTLD